jgi:hypothetical protein
VLEGRNLGSSCDRDMLLYANLGRRAWYCGLGNAHPISRLRAAARSRFVLSPGSFRPMAKKREE